MGEGIMVQTIITLPETDQTTLCVRLTGTITADDYLNDFDLPLRAMVDTHGFLKLCLIYDENFEGWSKEAADLSFKNISDLAPKARKTAYVNAPDSRLLLMKMMQSVMDGKIAYFETGQEAEALAWAKS
jgi:hypothetical protein